MNSFFSSCYSVLQNNSIKIYQYVTDFKISYPLFDIQSLCSSSVTTFFNALNNFNILIGRYTTNFLIELYQYQYQIPSIIDYSTCYIFWIPVFLFIILTICVITRQRIRNRAGKNGYFIGEDSYQLSRHNLNGEAYIFVRLEYNKDKISEDEIEKRVIMATEFITNYFYDHHPEFFKINNGVKILDYILIQRENIECYDDIISREHNECYSPKIIRFVYSKKERVIVMVFNHLFLGGFSFVTLGNIFTTGRMPTQLIDVPYTPYLTELITLKFLICEYVPRKFSSFDSLISYQDLNRIDRFIGNIKMDDLMNPKRLRGISDITTQQIMIPKKIILIHDILTRIIDSLPKEQINVIIPFAFNFDKVMFNNVGAILLTFNKGMSIQELNKALQKRYYHVIATNYLMNFINRGKEARNKADVVLTMAYAVTNSSDQLNTLNNIAISFRNKPDYSIYCCSYTVSGIAHITITNTSKDFDCDKIMSDKLFTRVQ